MRSASTLLAILPAVLGACAGINGTNGMGSRDAATTVADADPKAVDARPMVDSPPGVGPSPFVAFGEATISFDLQVNGNDSNMDSIALWEAPVATDSLMFVTSRDDNLVQVWRYPFGDANRLADITPTTIESTEINGVVVDQDLDRVFITEGTGGDTNGRNRVHVYQLPGQTLVTTFGDDIPTVRAEANLTILTKRDGTKWIYITTDEVVYMYDLADYSFLGSFTIPVSSSMEELLADDFYQRIYVVDEQGAGPIVVVDASGTTIDGFGEAAFSEDMEGIALYPCPGNGVADDGRGLIIVSDQRAIRTNEYEFFDRQGYAHLGTLMVTGIRNTDGIASTQLALPLYPKGLLAMMDNDTDAAVVGWDDILAATGLSCD